jgi:DNA-binding PadR family transcriptional regulator
MKPPARNASGATCLNFRLTQIHSSANMTLYDMSPKDITESLPLSEPVLLILLSLAGQPQHGYAILKDVERMSDGRVVLSTGTLYGALRRLLDDDWIERFEEEETSRGRQAYRLTPQGRRNLQTEIDRMKNLTRLATLRVATKES